MSKRGNPTKTARHSMKEEKAEKEPKGMAPWMKKKGKDSKKAC